MQVVFRYFCAHCRSNDCKLIWCPNATRELIITWDVYSSQHIVRDGN